MSELFDLKNLRRAEQALKMICNIEEFRSTVRCDSARRLIEVSGVCVGSYLSAERCRKVQAFIDGELRERAIELRDELGEMHVDVTEVTIDRAMSPEPPEDIAF